MRRFLTFLLVPLSFIYGYAQTSDGQPEFPVQPSDKFIFEHFISDPADGLGTLGLAQIRKHNGFIWSSGGSLFNEIIRFDGVTFKSAQLYFRDALIKASTYYFLFDRKGQLWYGARGNIFMCKKPGSWVKKAGSTDKYKLQIDTIYTEVLEQDYVTNVIGEDRQGNLWIAQSSGKLYLFNPESGVRKIFKFPAGQQVVDWLLDKQGRVWVISNKELYVLNSRKHNFTPVSIGKAMGISAGTELRKIFLDIQNNLWVGTDREGVFQFTFRSGKSGSILSQFRKPPLLSYRCGNVQGIVQDKDMRIWVGTHDQGLCVYDYKTKVWEKVRHNRSNPSGLSFDGIGTMFADSNGAVWIGMAMGGIEMFDPDKNLFRLLTEVDNGYKKTSETSHMYFGRGDSLDVFESGQDYELVYSIKERKYKPAFKSGLPRLPAIVQIWIKDETNREWFINNQGIHTYDLKRCKLDLYPFPDGRQYKIPIVNTAAIVTNASAGRGRSGREMWIGDQQGLIRFDIDKREWLDNSDLSVKLRNIVAGKSIFLIKSGWDGSVYISGAYVPSLKYETGSGKVHLAGYGNEAKFTMFLFEEESSVWAGTDLGLYELSKADFSVKAKHHLGESEYPGSLVSMIIRAHNKHFWVFGSTELIEYLPGKGVLKRYRYDDELKDAPNSLSSIYQHKDGTIFFAGHKGIIYFNPKDLKTNTFVPPVRITDIYVMGKSQSADSKELQLKYKQNFIDIEFIALNFTNAAKNQYKYKMEGIDEQWINAGTKRTANYTNLPPGEYTFRVIGSNNDGIWNREGASLKITIMPPWWGTWWFRSLLIILFVGGIFGLFRYRLSQQLRQREAEIRASLMAQEAERQRFSRELHDGIGANLSLLKMYLSSFGDADVPMAELKERSERLLAGSVDEIRRLIHDMHPRNLKEMGLVRAVDDMVSLVNLGNGLKVEFDAQNVPEHLPEQVQINLFRIVQELLQNAMKHSEASSVHLNFACKKEMFFLLYEDNGVGFDTSIAPVGNGLINIKNRVMLLKGEMRSRSSSGQGTAIEIDFEYAYQYVEETGLLSGVPACIERYFDYEAFAKDLFLEGLIIASSFSGWNKKNKEPFDAAASNGSLGINNQRTHDLRIHSNADYYFPVKKHRLQATIDVFDW